MLSSTSFHSSHAFFNDIVAGCWSFNELVKLVPCASDLIALQTHRRTNARSERVRHLPYLQVILVPDLLFLAFLCVRARRCYDILCRNPSVIMWTYYCLVWAVSIINVGRTLLQTIGNTADGHQHGELWTALWLVTRFVMVMLEVCFSGSLVSSSHARYMRACDEARSHCLCHITGVLCS
jgi:Predicted membrane protein